MQRSRRRSKENRQKTLENEDETREYRRKLEPTIGLEPMTC
jgi:hypothetical protein